MRTFGIAIAVALLLTATYIGSYYAVVDRSKYAKQSGPARADFDVIYSIGDELPKTIYAPWHYCDRRLRPDYWSMSISNICP